MFSVSLLQEDWWVAACCSLIKIHPADSCLTVWNGQERWVCREEKPYQVFYDCPKVTIQHSSYYKLRGLLDGLVFFRVSLQRMSFGYVLKIQTVWLCWIILLNNNIFSSKVDLYICQKICVKDKFFTIYFNKRVNLVLSLNSVLCNDVIL